VYLAFWFISFPVSLLNWELLGIVHSRQEREGNPFGWSLLFHIAYSIHGHLLMLAKHRFLWASLSAEQIIS
jgi:hypothetical protein